jgi:hypothetical protein
VAHTYNPSYSGGRDREDRNKTEQIVLETLSQKTHHKIGLVGVTQGVGPEFKPTTKKKVI